MEIWRYLSYNKIARVIVLQKNNIFLKGENSVKKSILNAASFVFAAGIIFGVSACSINVPKNNNSSTGQKVDSTKAQLNVFSYDGGFGSEWLYKAAERYEKLHASDSYNGKTGIQVQITPDKTSVTPASVKGDNYDIYSTESVDYYSFVNSGALLDISEVYSGENPYEKEKTIDSKLTDAQRSYYNADGKYYGLPGYGGYFGIAYNISLFEEQGYYIKDNADFSGKLADCFTRSESKRSTGPDGLKGTSDDGLPVTYDEFFYLCKYMLATNSTPIIWSGLYYMKHLTGLTHALVTQAEGEEQMMLTYSLDGTATDLGSVSDGGFLFDEENMAITTSNGYELARKKGNYDALTFLWRLINETVGGEHCYHKDSFTGGVTHTGAQELFLKEGIANNHHKIGMLVDGSWWENEASGVFDSLETSMGEEYSRANSRFGWMPLPKAEKDDKGITLSDSMYSLMFAKGNTEEWKKAVIIDFLQFLHTDESLQEYSITTNTMKALKYDMGENYNLLSAYGKSLCDLTASANVVYPLSKNSVFINNQNTFRDLSALGLYQANINKTEYQNPAKYFYEDNGSVKAYFNGMYTFMKTNKSTIWTK